MLDSILPLLHLNACALLACASFYRLLSKGNAPGGHRFLFPYTIIASAAGALMIGAPLFQLVAYYGQSAYLWDSLRMRFGGPYWWFYSLWISLPILPFLGFLPAIGRKPWIMVGIGITSVLPDLYLLLVPALASFLR